MNPDFIVYDELIDFDKHKELYSEIKFTNGSMILISTDGDFEKIRSND